MALFSVILAIQTIGVAILAFVLSRKKPVTGEPLAPPMGFSELEARVEKLERSWNGWMEEADDRIERGNKAWRRVAAARRREEKLEEEEEWGEFPEGDAGGGEGQTMLPLSDGMGGFAGGEPGWEEKKRLLNRQIAGLA